MMFINIFSNVQCKINNNEHHLLSLYSLISQARLIFSFYMGWEKIKSGDWVGTDLHQHPKKIVREIFVYITMCRVQYNGRPSAIFRPSSAVGRSSQSLVGHFLPIIFFITVFFSNIAISLPLKHQRYTIAISILTVEDLSRRACVS